MSRDQDCVLRLFFKIKPLSGKTKTEIIIQGDFSVKNKEFRRRILKNSTGLQHPVSFHFKK
jgi:hypothetical protein